MKRIVLPWQYIWICLKVFNSFAKFIWLWHNVLCLFSNFWYFLLQVLFFDCTYYLCPFSLSPFFNSIQITTTRLTIATTVRTVTLSSQVGYLFLHFIIPFGHHFIIVSSICWIVGTSTCIDVATTEHWHHNCQYHCSYYLYYLWLN